MGAAQLEGKVIAVTGVSSGLGRALVFELTAQGAKVAGVARRAELGAELADEVAAAGGELLFVQGDLTTAGSCAAFVDAAVERFGGIDVLINNAAARTDPPLTPLHELDERNFDAVMDTNAKAPLFCAQAAIRHMMARRSGTVINIGSYSGVLATSQMAVYGMAKAAVIQLSRAIAVEYAEVGVRSVAIMLGKTATGQAQRYAAAWEDAPDQAAADATDPTVQAQDPVAVAQAIALLCTDQAALFNGATISIDQGVSAGLYTSKYTYHLLAADR